MAIIDAKVTTWGSFVPKSKKEILEMMALTIEKQKQMKPLADNKISNDAKNIFASMKPVIANMLGQFGQGMEFICFKGVDDDGKRLLDPLGNRSFRLTLGESEYNWRLPLGSLLPSKYDPKTGETFPGNYLYNPFTGNKLTSTLNN